QLKKKGFKEVVFSVPSGNFGNIGAGLLAYKMGLPVKQFIAATNVNDTVPRFLETGVYETKPSVQTYANAMDVGAPSNWVRIMDMFNQDTEVLKALVTGYRFTDEETLAGIKAIDANHNYIACPHTAIAYLAVERYRNETGYNGAAAFLSTAHACKFPDIFPAELATKIEIPASVKELEGRIKQADELGVNFEGFKNWLVSKN
ncbi:MAG: pyridoxal-phosphate dependent enzyme, partial [Pedobacter sp.]